MEDSVLRATSDESRTKSKELIETGSQPEKKQTTSLMVVSRKSTQPVTPKQSSTNASSNDCVFQAREKQQPQIGRSESVIDSQSSATYQNKNPLANSSYQTKNRHSQMHSRAMSEIQEVPPSTKNRFSA